MTRTTSVLLLAALFGLIFAGCGGGGGGGDAPAEAPSVAGEWWLTSLSSSAGSGFLPSTSWGSASLAADGSMSILVSSDEECGSSTSGPTAETGTTYVVQSSGAFDVVTSSGETGAGQVSPDGSFISVGITSSGASPTLACLLKKEGGHSTANIAGDWHMVAMLDCDSISRIACYGLITLDGTGGWTGMITCNEDQNIISNIGESGQYVVGADGAFGFGFTATPITVSTAPSLGGVGSGGQLAIAAGRETDSGGRNMFVALVRRSTALPADALGTLYHQTSYRYIAQLPAPVRECFTGDRQVSTTTSSQLTGSLNTDGAMGPIDQVDGGRFLVDPNGLLAQLDVPDVVFIAGGGLRDGGGVGIMMVDTRNGQPPGVRVLIRK